MRPSRPLLLIASTFLVLILVGGGLLVRVGAAESTSGQAVLFAEVLSLVLDNYVDEVASQELLQGAYEGMLGGIDPNGAYLTVGEVLAWKQTREADLVDPGISVLKAGRSLQIVAVEPSSPAADAEISVGDQIRSIDGRLTRDLSLEQARRLIRGRAGSSLRLSLLHPSDGFSREELELTRAPRRGRSYELAVRDGIAVLRLRDLSRIAVDELVAELQDVRSRGVERLLVDLRNLAEGGPRDVKGVARVFSGSSTLKLRDRSGRLIETLESDATQPLWDEPVSLLVNGATAGGSEALAVLLREARGAAIFGESSYGLGAEARLYELEDGSALLVSAARWETGSGTSWNDDGIEPDTVVNGEGSDIEEAAADQLQRVLDILKDDAAPAYPKAA